MPQRTSWRLLLSGIAIWLTSSAGRAEFIQWKYDASPIIPFVISDNHRLGSVHLTPAAGTAIGSTRLVLANVFAVSDAPITNPDRFTQRPFKINLNITDVASKVTGKAVFTGVIDGTDSLFSSLLTFRLTSPATQQLHLGHHIYNIHLDNLTPPGPPNSSTSGSIGATVLVSHNPEPSSLVLAGFGAVVFGLRAWKHRRRKGDSAKGPAAK